MCDPSELTADGADGIGYGVWSEADGDAVPTSEVMTLKGAEQCGWEEVTLVEVGRSSTHPQQFVHDPSRELDERLLSTYAARTSLPRDASDSGWRRGGFALWLRPRGDAAYLVNLADPNDVQRWPRAKRSLSCV
jgi:hypothetical protein